MKRVMSPRTFIGFPRDRKNSTKLIAWGFDRRRLKEV
jgi:hypothetical protein